MKNANIKVLCQTAILIAVYVLLSMTLVIRRYLDQVVMSDCKPPLEENR